MAIEIKEKKQDMVIRYSGKGTENRDVLITVDERRCKACDICVKFCPGNVLQIKDFVVKVIKIEGCNKCMRCELLCPDFAIYVE